MKLSAFILTLAFCLAFWMLYPGYLSRHNRGQWEFGCDLSVYYIGGGGQWQEGMVPKDVMYRDDPEPYLYPSYTRIAFAWLHLMPFPVAFLVWYCIISLSLAVISYKLAGLPYGWLLVLGLLRSYSWELESLNMVPIVALLVTTPLGCLLAGAFKSFTLGVLGIHALASSRGVRPLAVLVQRARYALHSFRGADRAPK